MDLQRLSVQSRLAGTILLGVVAATLLPGCGGGIDFGGDVRVPAEQQHVIKAEQHTNAPLSLPADHRFNIHIKRSSQDLAAEGQARGESNATADGQAYASASAANGGSATAMFQIGHRLDNESGQVQSVAIEVQFDLVQEIKASQQPEPHTIAKADLHLVILDTHRRTVAKTTLIQATSDDAISSATGSQRRTVTATFEPNQSYDVVLFAQVEAATDSGQEAVAQIDVKNLQMIFTFASVARQASAAKHEAGK